jgi:hypothetical protein
MVQDFGHPGYYVFFRSQRLLMEGITNVIPTIADRCATFHAITPAETIERTAQEKKDCRSPLQISVPAPHLDSLFLSSVS